MKLAKITFVRGMFIPGHGNVVSLENVEVEGTSIPVAPYGVARMPVHGLVIVTSTAKVLIPWERVESVVTEWIPAPRTEEIQADIDKSVAGIVAAHERAVAAQAAAAAQGAQAQGTGMFAHVERAPQGLHGPGLAAMLRAKNDAQDILNMTEKSDAAFHKNAKAFEEFHQEVAKEVHGALVAGAVQAATIGAKDAVVVAGPLLTEEGREQVRAQLQPPPPSKKGGRR